MGFECLEVKRIARNGDALKTVRCFAGRVTVFRARTEDVIEPYCKALFGEATAEKFSLVLDGLELGKDQRIVVGGGRAEFGDLTVRSFLLSRGMLEEKVSAELGAASLAGKESELVSALPEREQRIVELLAAFSRPDKVQVFIEPFMILAEDEREDFAARLADYAWRNKVIVVVLSVHDRPQCWIDNELISRIQLDEYRRRSTIGFGGGPSAVAGEIEQLRASLPKTQEVTYFDSRSNNPVVTEQEREEILAVKLGHAERQKKLRMVATFAVVFVLLSVGAYGFFSSAPLKPMPPQSGEPEK